MAARKKVTKSRQKTKRKKTKFSNNRVSRHIQNRVKELQTKLDSALAKQVVHKEDASTTTADLLLKKPSEPSGVPVSPSEYNWIVAAFKDPRINNRHKILSLIHNHLVWLEVQFQRDIFQLEDRYLKEYYAPLLGLRKALIEASSNGKQNYPHEKALVEKCRSSFTSDLQKFTELQLRVERLLFSGHGDATKNCNDFWLVVFLQSDPILRDLILPCDVDILKYLTDVRSEPVRIQKTDEISKNKDEKETYDIAIGYDLFFDFRPNPYFSNSVLTKRYLIDVSPDQYDHVITPHREVLETNWVEKPSENVKSTLYKQSPLCNLILNQDHLVDKLLNYQGPQIVSIQGCQVRWTNKASFMRKEGKSLKSYYDKNRGFYIKDEFTMKTKNDNYSATQKLRKENGSDFNIFSHHSLLNSSSEQDSQSFSPSVGFSKETLLSGTLEGRNSMDSEFYSSADPNNHNPSTSFSSNVSPFSCSNPVLASDQTHPQAGNKRKSNGAFSTSYKLNIFAPPTSSNFNNTNSKFAREEWRKMSSSTKSLNFFNLESDPDQFFFSEKSCFPKVTRGVNSVSRTSMDILEQTPVNIETEQLMTQTGTPNQDPESVDMKDDNMKESAKKSKQKSFFDFFDITWSEKSPNHGKEMARDYLVGTYIKDVLVPRAYSLYRQKDLESIKKDARKHQVNTCMGKRYDKEFSLPTNTTPPTTYDEIDEDIPIAVTKQALTKIESCASFKKEILDGNRETETRLANSFIGQMMKLRDDVAGGVGDDAAISPKKSPSTTFENKLDIDETVLTSSSHNSSNFFGEGSESILSPSTTEGSLSAIFEPDSQSSSVQNQLSLADSKDSTDTDSSLLLGKDIYPDVFKWCSYIKTETNVDLKTNPAPNQNSVEMSVDHRPNKPVFPKFVMHLEKEESKNPPKTPSPPVETQKPPQSERASEIHLTTIYDSPASETNLYQTPSDPYLMMEEENTKNNAGNTVEEPVSEINKETSHDVTMKSDETRDDNTPNVIAEANDVTMTQASEITKESTTNQ